MSPINKTIIQTDASQKGWGAYCQEMSIGSQWTLEESRLHINPLERKAINLVLLTFSYLMKMGGTGSREMTALTKEIWKFALSQIIIITADCLAGKLNVRAN